MKTITAAQEIVKLTQSLQGPFIIAIDGRCCAGKSTLAAKIAQLCDCNIFKTDDFYLPPQQSALRTPYGGNMNAQRFAQEVLAPLAKKQTVFYLPYDCKKGAFKETTKISFKNINIIEGCYCLLPALRGFYTHSFFVDISPAAQQARLQKREGEKAKIFNEVWIKKEEEYFAAHAPQQIADKIFELEGF